jgi:alkaline phosphatase D
MSHPADGPRNSRTPRDPRSPRARRLSRRRFLEITASLSVVPLASALPGCGDSNDASFGPETLFEHGVASGDPLPDAVILWTRLSPLGAGAVDVVWEMALDESFSATAASGTARADEERDFTVKVDATGLAPGTTYYYRFQALGRTSPIGRTRTAPADGVERLRFAVVSCSSLAHGYFHAYRRVAERTDLDAVIHVGDYIYEYGDGEYGSVRGYEPPHEIVALEDYRLRYSQYRRDPDLQEVHRLFPMIAIWDDHESADNSWSNGAVNHQPATEGSWEVRRAAAEQVYSEWMPIRDQAGGQIWRSFRFGDLIDLILLDTRLWHRDEPAPSTADPIVRDPRRQILGDDQEAFFAGELADSSARWRIVGQQVMMAPLKLSGAPNSEGGGTTVNPDQWDGYLAARDRFFATVRSSGKDNLVVLTGDIHTSWAIELSDDPNNPDVYDPATGAGAIGVEFVTTSITSPGIAGINNDLIPVFQGANPHIKWADLEQRGYLILDVTPERAQAAWFHVDDITDPNAGAERFARAVAIYDGETLLREESAPA